MDGKVKLVFMALILSALVMGCTSPEKVVKAGDTVFVDYTLKDVNGTVLETTNKTIAQGTPDLYNPGTVYEPISFVAGSGMMIKGFDEAVIGMKVNETKNVTLLPARAYGEYNESLVVTTPPLTNTNVSNFTDYVGKYINFNGMCAKLVAVNETTNTMVLDYNPQMAGKTLVFDITVRSINPSPTPKPK